MERPDLRRRRTVRVRTATVVAVVEPVELHEEVLVQRAGAQVAEVQAADGGEHFVTVVDAVTVGVGDIGVRAGVVGVDEHVGVGLPDVREPVTVGVDRGVDDERHTVERREALRVGERPLRLHLDRAVLADDQAALVRLAQVDMDPDGRCRPEPDRERSDHTVRATRDRTLELDDSRVVAHRSDARPERRAEPPVREREVGEAVRVRRRTTHRRAT